MLAQLIITFCVCASVMLLVCWLRSLLTRPVRPGKGIEISVAVKITGSAPELEGVVKSLLWLCESGTLPAKPELVDAGMDGETRAVAEALAGDNNLVIRRLPPDG